MMGRHQILRLLCFLFFLYSSLPFASSLCPSDQRDVLLHFKDSLVHSENLYVRDSAYDHFFCDPDVDWNNSSPEEHPWEEGTNCCSWDGVTCDNVTGDVIGLDITTSRLRGAFHPNSSLLLPKLQVLRVSFCNLSKFPNFLNSLKTLTHLDLSFNRIAGEIPAWFWAIGHDTLETLDLSHNLMEGGVQPLQWKILSSFLLRNNNFSGEIPSSICQLSLLSELDFSSNHFSGNVPPCFSNITTLSFLDLSSNQFQGPLPTPPPSTRSFDASNNGFVGEIPPSFCKLSELFILRLSNNDLSGNMPPCFGNVTGLLDFDLSNNKLQGPLPRSLVLCSQLYSLVLSHNRFNDIFPNWLKALNLENLDLRSNKFHGKINLTVFGLSFPRLESLLISNNNFTGRWPMESFLNTSISVMDLSNNKFVGSIPLPSPATYYYSIASNKIRGNVPSLFCNATHLAVINLSDNDLTGNLPQCLTSSDILLVLNLRNNHLEGGIPQSFSWRSNLTTLDLSQNQLNGTLPWSLGRCRHLEVLDLSDNLVEDTFPTWLGTLQELKVLVLRSNNFTDLISIPEGSHLFPDLHILDLSNNNFGGPLPTNLVMNLKGMMDDETRQDTSLYMTRSFEWASSYENSVTVTIKGQEIELTKILTIFTTIDLSHNSFQGYIPTAFGHLHSLIGLNLSHNYLTGSIPLTLGDLSNLGWLDLSSNMLSGGIPRKLGDLAALGYLNLSKNQLDGRIPQDKQLSTFSIDSFRGNPGLCGTPLPKSCPDDAQPPPPSSLPTFDHEVHESWFKHKAVWLGYASGMVIGISIGYIAFEIGRPKWLARVVYMLERRAANLRKKKRKAIKFHG